MVWTIFLVCRLQWSYKIVGRGSNAASPGTKMANRHDEIRFYGHPSFGTHDVRMQSPHSIQSTRHCSPESRSRGGSSQERKDREQIGQWDESEQGHEEISSTGYSFPNSPVRSHRSSEQEFRLANPRIFYFHPTQRTMPQIL